MSKEEKPPLDLSGLDFGPAWAKDKAPGRDYSKEVGPREGRDSRGRGPRREGGGDRRQNDRRGSAPSGDRRDQRNGGGDRRQNDRRQGDRRQGGRRDDRRDDRREYQPPTPAPDGFVGGVMPVEEGLDNLAREIKGGGRTYSVFDLARVVMGARERFNVTFEAPKGTTFFRCKSDGSIWLTKEEAVQQFWRADLLAELYEEVVQTIDPPKGNFTAVAKCGLSGEWLGPPNYHGYPTEVARIHAERFSHMSLEDYKRRIRNESGEEVVQSWLDAQTKEINYRPLSTAEILALRETRKAAEAATDAPSDKIEAPATSEQKDEPKLEATDEQGDPQASAPESAEVETPAAPPEETSASALEDDAPTDEHSPAEEPQPEPPVETAAVETQASPPQLLADRKEVERHFVEHHFKHLFAEVDRAWVPANVPAKLLSPGLLTLLKDVVSEERRYPAKLTPILCRQLSGRHLAVFKWKKKLKAGPARPHAIPDDLNLAERPQILLSWTEANSGKTLEDLWKACLPEPTDEDLKRNFYHDLHWLLNQGYLLLMADGTLHLAKGKASEQAPQSQPKKEVAKKTAKAPTKPTDQEATQNPSEASTPNAEPTPQEVETSAEKDTQADPPNQESAESEQTLEELPAENPEASSKEDRTPTESSDPELS